MVLTQGLSYAFEPFLIYSTFHNSTKQLSMTSTLFPVHSSYFTNINKSSSTSISASAREDQSTTSKFQSWNYSNLSYRASSGQELFLSGQLTLPNTCTSTTSKHPARTRMAMNTLHRSAGTLIARRSAGTSVLQLDFET